MSLISVVHLSMTSLHFFFIVFFISVLTFSRLSSIISYAVSSDLILLAGIDLFQIVLSRGSSKWRMFRTVHRKKLSLLFSRLANSK